MKLRKQFLCVLIMCAVFLSGWGTKNNADTQTEVDTQAENAAQAETTLCKIDMTKWQYNGETDVYWQTGIVYCTDPADETYENLGIYVPGAYMNGTGNADGTYTCEINASGTVGGFTAETAPIVLPGGYAWLCGNGRTDKICQQHIRIYGRGLYLCVCRVPWP